MKEECIHIEIARDLEGYKIRIGNINGSQEMMNITIPDILDLVEEKIRRLR